MAVGEVVFNTSMTGYQVSRPSFLFSPSRYSNLPLIGNVGTNAG
ncbi:carbamoyl-phosphate synthase domain-containing protein [Shigella flexneri]